MIYLPKRQSVHWLLPTWIRLYMKLVEKALWHHFGDLNAANKVLFVQLKIAVPRKRNSINPFVYKLPRDVFETQSNCREARTKLDTDFSRIFWWGHLYDYVIICDVTYWTLCSKYTIFCCKWQFRICDRRWNIIRLHIKNEFLCSGSSNSLKTGTSDGTLSWLFTEFIRRLIAKISNINSENLFTTAAREIFVKKVYSDIESEFI